MKPWVGVDLDRTLAVYDKWRGELHIGEPVEKMVEIVRMWLTMGYDVRIVTARVGREKSDVDGARAAIEAWSLEHIGQVLPVTCEKDLAMTWLWDDRAIQVMPNQGIPVTDLLQQAVDWFRRHADEALPIPSWLEEAEDYFVYLDIETEKSLASLVTHG